jgi:hypothetical protein
MQDEEEEEQFSETESPTHLRQLLAAELGQEQCYRRDEEQQVI